jgi:hypothetical protein
MVRWSLWLPKMGPFITSGKVARFVAGSCPRKLSIVDMHFAAGLDELACRTSRGEVFSHSRNAGPADSSIAQFADSPTPPQRKHSPATGDFTWPR